MQTSLPASSKSVQSTVYAILFAISFTHLLNDLIQSVIPAVYPLLKRNYGLSFTQIGLITLVFQLTASILQPFVGHFTDKKPNPQSLSIGMSFTFSGLLCLAFAGSFLMILASVSLIGMGSSVFHPEASRVAHLASGGKKGLAQSIFQVGGNAGSAIGPLLAALIVIPLGQAHISWFALAAVLAIIILIGVGRWYQANVILKKASANTASPPVADFALDRKKVIFSIVILLLLIFSKYFYMASMTSYFTFFLIEKFHVSVQQSQIYLFVFLAAVAAGTIIGGPLGDRYGRKRVIWFSILGAAPFTLMLPYTGLFWTIILSAVIGVIISSAFSAILVYATDLVPGKVGMIAGLFFGFAFGMGGIGSAVLGWLADQTSIEYVFKICAFLPLMGIIAGLLPDLAHGKTAR
ncbi:FSR family fosmidomycin resistance protein-like MFS transporter [Anseongella ginsenosidimutans]|uniref:FSR family fosmidomycin resistance protein-like MFS transporter n=1 Tax=Anseongella ginsenosidimutans TaxID=496056 RepID=A0A4R3KSC0_9SPHI|nr:MFS transporter [Anseongella ginsenosidimutans]QEC53000.1 MFS transporter [Anseongella ginsenosidimutans]TCS87407.1 FSR family fosmidomycin resistance protein-like MFS transporter [Anseongella ginsenosidimutans]